MMNRNSPMMEQYNQVKKQHPDKIVMFQVGDFYEMFFEDAEIAAREMDIALTSRDAKSENPIPLAGVPIHTVETYLNRLINKGYKVVICDQTENATQTKGLVKRDITRILTPGTITEAELLDEGRNNFLVALVGEAPDKYGMAAIDISTGDFQVTEQQGVEAWEIIADELRRIKPAEILCSDLHLENLCCQIAAPVNNVLITRLPAVPEKNEALEILQKHWNSQIIQDLDSAQYTYATIAAAAALFYLQGLKQLPAGAAHIRPPALSFSLRYMMIDNITSRNLELAESHAGGGKKCSLLGIIDHCLTGMGRRSLKRRLEQPLIEQPVIQKRLDAVEELVGKPITRRDIRSLLVKIFDLERFCSRLAYGKATAHDLVVLKDSLKLCEPLKILIQKLEAADYWTLIKNMPDFEDLINLIDQALVDEPPLALREGGLFRDGYSEDLDRLRKITREGSKLLLEFEKEERIRTGIRSLKVGYNRNFGYYIEVTRTNLDLVPAEYHRKQTLVGAERYTTEELHSLEEQITGAREKLVLHEYELFINLRDTIATRISQLRTAAEIVSEIDFHQGLAEAADRYSYCKPTFSDNGLLQVKQARHPVVEQLTSEKFIANDIKIDNDAHILLLTGPNMAGKSTYIRSVAYLSVMAQMGSFVPAQEAFIPIFDRIFARVGASDDLSSGHSTFMVEMLETATILKEATQNSLIVLDEIGRGTSTYDGMSIARAVIEYIAKTIKAKTLFSTHYHELTRLESELAGVKNYTMAVKEKGKEVVFLRQIIPGRADKSYGINVARLAGLPAEVLSRAETILNELELSASTTSEQQLSLLPIISEKKPLEEQPGFAVLERLKEYDLNRMTPLDTMKTLYEIQQELLELEGKIY